MNIEAVIVLAEIPAAVLIAMVIMAAKLAWDLYQNRQWKRSLNKEELLGLERELALCLSANGLTPGTAVRIEDAIRGRGYAILEKPALFFRQAYTSQPPEKNVYVRKFLSQEQRHFALAHELTHIIYRPEELGISRRNRNAHLFFAKRDPDEQKRDYMAASLILPREQFWRELMDARYFELDSKERTAFVYEAAWRHNVETATVFRRISELVVIMG